MRQKIPAILALLLLLTACGRPAGGQPSPENHAPTWQEQYDLGVRYLSEGNYQEAILAFTAAIEIDPKRAPAYLERGNAYILSGETEENLTSAQADYEKAIDLDEASAEAYLGLADVYIRQGDYDKALEILQEGLEKTGENQDIADKIKEIESGKISDSSGRVRRQNYYDPDGNLKRYYTRTYYDNGYEMIWYDANGSIERRVVLTETDEEKIEITYDEDNTVMTKRVYIYREDGTEMGYESFTSNGTLMGRREYTFDINGKRNGFIDYAEDGKIIQHQETSTNEQGQTITSFYNANGTLREYYVPILNETGEEIGWTQYSADGTILGTSTFG